MSYSHDEEARLWEAHKARAMRGGLVEVRPTPIPHPETVEHAEAYDDWQAKGGQVQTGKAVKVVLRRRHKPKKDELVFDVESEAAYSHIISDWQRQSRGSVK